MWCQICGFHCAGLQRYGWLRHDGRSFGVQEIIDGHLNISTTFVCPPLSPPSFHMLSSHLFRNIDQLTDARSKAAPSESQMRGGCRPMLDTFHGPLSSSWRRSLAPADPACTYDRARSWTKPEVPPAVQRASRPALVDTKAIFDW